MHDLLFGRQGEWSGKADAVQTFKKFAGELGVNQSQFDACLDEGKYASKISADLMEGMQAGTSSTPTFYVNSTQLTGAQPLSAFQRYIDYYLAGGLPPTLEVSADAFNSLGRADAPVVVTEFSDFQ